HVSGATPPQRRATSRYRRQGLVRTRFGCGSLGRCGIFSIMRIQLLTFPECENAAAARELLARVLATSDIAQGFEEIDTQADGTPEPYRSYASPTILVDGVAVGDGDPRTGTWGPCC